MNPWTGPLAYLGRETVDGRTIDRLEWDRLPLPIVAVSRTDTRAPGDVIGRVETIDRRPSGEVIGTGTVDLPPGRYAVGASIRVDSTSGDSAPGRLIGVEAFDDERGAPWPEAVITVTDEPVTLTGGSSA